MREEFETTVEVICDRDTRYKEEAYLFVMEALSFTQRKLKCLRHVTGEELLDGIKELLIQKFGPMTLIVLRHWGISSTEDFGNLIFNLVEHNVLSKTEDDDISVFRNAYDFEEVFERGYHKRLARKIRRMRSI